MGFLKKLQKKKSKFFSKINDFEKK